MWSAQIVHHWSEILSVNVRPPDVRESVKTTREIDLTGLNSLVPESSLNALNGLNGLNWPKWPKWPESAQEQILSQSEF